MAGWIEGYLFKKEGGGDDEPPDTAAESSAEPEAKGRAEVEKGDKGVQGLVEKTGEVDLSKEA